MAELSQNWKKLQAKISVNPCSKQPLSAKKLATAVRSARVEKSRSSGYSSKPHQKRDRASHAIMGSVQSSKAKTETHHTQAASAQLWATDGNISSEGLAEAYGLGLRENSMTAKAPSDKVNHGPTSHIEVGKYVALDCEMVGIGPGGHESALARVSLVDFLGCQVYDSFVRPKQRVTDWRTSVSGISAKEMRFGRDFEEVQSHVSNILKGRILVGHDIKHDLKALQLSHPTKDIRDTAKHQAFRKHGHGRKPALRILARELLGIEIQQGSHSSTEDARVAMLLFRKYKSAFDVDHANHYSSAQAAVAKTKRKKQNRCRD